MASQPLSAPSRAGRFHAPAFPSLAAVLIALLVAASGCGRHSNSVLAPDAARPEAAAAARAPASTVDPAAALHLEGTIGPGAPYVIDVPDEWNGDLVVYLHGYLDPAQPVGLPAAPFGVLRPGLLERGYAVIASGYSANGYAAPEAFRETHQLRGVFQSRVGTPTRTYVIGLSLGAVAGMVMIERFPDQYDGALLFSGVVGGTQAEIDYIAHLRVLFDYFYPGVLPGEFPCAAITDFNAEVVVPVMVAVQRDPTGLGMLMALAPRRPPGATPQEILFSLLNVFGFMYQGGCDLLARTHGHMFFDNSDYVYTGPLPQPVLDEVNAGVDRYRATADARAWVHRWHEPSGVLRIPVLTRHNVNDPVVPFFHEELLAAAVERAGWSHHLQQRSVTQPIEHPITDAALLLGDFDDLVEWVDAKSAPAP